jgi:hypothetical protein
VSTGVAGTASVEAVKERSYQGMPTPPPPLQGGIKTDPEHLPGLLWNHWEGMNTSGYENETRLVAGGSLWRWVVGSDDLLLVPDPDDEGPCSTEQH